MSPFTVRAEVVLPAGAPHEVWEAARRDGVGGSDVAAVVGLSTYESRYTMWCYKTRRAVPRFDEEARRRMRWGHLLEPVVREEFAYRHPEYIVTQAPGTYAVPGLPWQRVNVDGLVWHPTGELAGVLEIKTGTHRRMHEWDDGEVPVGYTAQGQWACHVTGAPRTFFMALLDTSFDVETVVQRDDGIIGDLVELAGEFWECVVRDVPPPVDGSEATRQVLARVEAAAGTSVVLDAGWWKEVRRRHELHEQIKALEEEKAEIDNRLRWEMGAAESAYLVGRDGKRHRVASHRQPRPTRRVDWEALSAWPEVAARVVVSDPPGRRLSYARNPPPGESESTTRE